MVAPMGDGTAIYVVASADFGALVKRVEKLEVQAAESSQVLPEHEDRLDEHERILRDLKRGQKKLEEEISELKDETKKNHVVLLDVKKQNDTIIALLMKDTE